MEEVKREISNKEFMIKYARYHKFKEETVKEMEKNMSEIRAGIFIDFLISEGEINDDVCRKIFLNDVE